MTSGSYETESDVPEWVNPGNAEPYPAGHDAYPPGEDPYHAGDPEEPEYYDYRRRGSWGRRILVGVGLVLLVGVAAGGGLVLWINSHLGGSGGAPIQLTIPDQAGHSTLAAELGKAKVVSDSWLFRRYLDYRGVAPAHGGAYTFHSHEGYRAALADLDQGPKLVDQKLTIPEGYDLSQIAEKVGQLPGLSAAKFTALVTSGAVHSPYQEPGSTSLEGLVFPDTYFISAQDTEQAVLQKMVDRFSQVAAEVNLSASAQTNGLSPYQTVILASLIEKEAKIDADRGKISRVILNRLAKGMRLQIDATVLYAEGVHKTRVLNSDLATVSPYNTYKVAGLPPGPIAGPGKASLVAALNPTPGSWLYYVLIDASGQHGFATTNSEFNRLKAEAHAKGLL